MRFYENDTSYSLVTSPFKSEKEFSNGLWLLQVGINEIPPHIALVSDGKYYSLSVKKVDCGSSLERLMNTIIRKHIPSLFIQIETKEPPQTPKAALNSATQSPFRGLGLNGECMNTSMQKIYHDLQPLANSDTTCLSPIKEFFEQYISDEFSKANYVFELLALADQNRLLKKCITSNYESNNSNVVTLPKYSMTQIRNKINLLSIPIASTN